MTDLDRLLNAFDTAVQSGHGYLPTRRAIVDHVSRIEAERDALRTALAETRTAMADDMGPLV